MNREGQREGPIDVLVIGLDDPSDGKRYHYGLLVKQVHSIVRVEDRDLAARLRQTEGGEWEMAYEDGWIPLRHLRQSIGLAAPAGSILGENRTARVLSVKRPGGGSAGITPYTGLVVDDVIEIRSLPLREVLPFPTWVIRDLPPSTVWGAVPTDSSKNANLLLLLDGTALAVAATAPLADSTAHPGMGER
jgi:hypothetical protein